MRKKSLTHYADSTADWQDRCVALARNSALHKRTSDGALHYALCHRRTCSGIFQLNLHLAPFAGQEVVISGLSWLYIVSKQTAKAIPSLKANYLKISRGRAVHSVVVYRYTTIEVTDFADNINSPAGRVARVALRILVATSTSTHVGKHSVHVCMCRRRVMARFVRVPGAHSVAGRKYQVDEFGLVGSRS